MAKYILCHIGHCRVRRSSYVVKFASSSGYEGLICHSRSNFFSRKVTTVCIGTPTECDFVILERASNSVKPVMHHDILSRW